MSSILHVETASAGDKGLKVYVWCCDTHTVFLYRSTTYDILRKEHRSWGCLKRFALENQVNTGSLPSYVLSWNPVSTSSLFFTPFSSSLFFCIFILLLLNFIFTFPFFTLILTSAAQHPPLSRVLSILKYFWQVSMYPLHLLHTPNYKLRVIIRGGVVECREKAKKVEREEGVRCRPEL